MQENISIIDAFSSVPDPRYTKPDYPLDEIIFTTICAVISGADDWTSISMWGKNRLDFLRNFLPFKNGIPAHDTFGRVFAAIRTDVFESIFIAWVKQLFPDLKCDFIAIDGKTICRSYDRYIGKSAIHMVSAFVPGIGISMGQVRTEEKSNEITAIPKLLDLLNIKGCLVSIDAMGNQKKIAEKIIDEGGDYLLAVKGNQASQHEAISEFFETAEKMSYAGVEFQADEIIDKGHGRIEIRNCVVVEDLEWIPQNLRWKSMKTIIKIVSKRIVCASETVETRYYLSSKLGDAKYFNKRVRGHWEIENRLHWNLEVSFNEDQSSVRVGNAAVNLSIIRRFALNLLRMDKSVKVGIKNKRKNAGWNQNYLANLLNL